MKQKSSLFWVLALAASPFALWVTEPPTVGGEVPPLAVAPTVVSDSPPAPPVPLAPPSAPFPEMAQTAALPLSPPAREVARMTGSGVPDDVIRAYIDNSPHTYNLTADGIIYLQGQKVSSALTAEMIRHDRKLRDQIPAGVLNPPVAPAVPYPYQPAPQTPQFQQPDYAPSSVQVITIPTRDYNPYGQWQYGADYGYYWQPHLSVGYPWGSIWLNSGRWWHHPGRGLVWSPHNQFHGGVGFGQHSVGGHGFSSHSGRAVVTGPHR